MSTKARTAILVLGLAFIGIAGRDAVGAVCEHAGCTWIATGAITRIDGPSFNILGKDNLIYTIEASRAELLSDFAADSSGLRVGDKVRVYGTVAGAQRITASRVRVMDREMAAAPEQPKKEIKIIYERPAAEQPGAGPQTEAQADGTQAPDAEECACLWEGRGLITDVDYTGRMLKLRTSTGQFTVNLGGAQLVHGSRQIGLGRLSLGDAVRVIGTQSGTNEVDARQIRVLRTRTEAENALPQMPISIGGVIQQIDHPSLTFKMWTETTPMVVMADQDTLIQQQQCRLKFADLKPGMRIKMNGYGSLGTGYAAREILVIGVSPF